MHRPARVLLAVILASSLIGSVARHAARPAAALALQGTIFVGTVTCTLDNSFDHIHTNAAGQTEESTLEEHARTTFVLAQGKPIVGTGTYSSRYTTRFTDPASDVQDRSERTLRGSYSGPIQQPNDFSGFELNRPTELLVYTLQIPVTFTYAQSHETKGHVLAQNDPPRPQGSISYPDRDTPLPILAVRDDRPALSGGVSREVIDSQTRKVDGHDGCTWSLLVVLFNGKPLRGVRGSTTTITPAASYTPTATRTPPTEHVAHGPITLTPTATPTLLQGGVSSGTPTAIAPGSQCMPQESRPVPIATDSAPGGFGDRPAQQAAAPRRPVTQAGIIWSASRPLTWNDFKGDYRKEPNPASRQYDALTKWQLITGVGLGRYCLPTSGTVTTVTIPVTLPSEDASFVPSTSWVKPGNQSAHLLDHEQRHFDIAEVYQRRIRLILTADIGAYLSADGKTLRFPCAATPPCEQQVRAFVTQANNDGTRLFQEEMAEQERYDRTTDHSKIPTVQDQWDTSINDCLALKLCVFPP